MFLLIFILDFPLLKVECFPVLNLPTSAVEQGEKHARIYTSVCRQCCGDNLSEAVVAYLEPDVQGSIIKSRLESQGHWNYETDMCGRLLTALTSPLPPPVSVPRLFLLLLLLLHIPEATRSISSVVGRLSHNPALC